MLKYLSLFLLFSLTFVVNNLVFGQRPDEEDLSIYRNVYSSGKYSREEKKVESSEVLLDTAKSITPTHHINSELDSTFSKIKDFFDGITTTQGYRVQLYSGNDMNRSASIESEARKYSFSGQRVYRDYKAPTWKVRVGDFVDKLSAEQLYQKIKKNFLILVGAQRKKPK